MEEYKSVQRYRKKHQTKTTTLQQGNKLKKFFISLLSRTLIVIILSLTVLISIKNPMVKGFIKEQVFHTNLPFAVVKEWYQKNLGNIIPLVGNTSSIEPVFQEKMTYKDKKLYQDGVSLTVGKQYLVPVLESGIIVFIGEKEGYGSTVIIQQVDGVDLWYANITPSNLKLYDYVEKGSLLGESKEEEIYLVFQKEGKFLDYQDYLQ